MSKTPAKPPAGSKNEGEVDPNGAGTEAQPVVVPDPTVMLYLRAASQAFPRIQQQFSSMIAADMRVTQINRVVAQRLEYHLGALVQQNLKERDEMRSQIQAAKLRKVELESTIAQRRREFESERNEKAQENAQTLASLRREISQEIAFAKEAESWQGVRGREIKDLDDLEQRLQSFQERSEVQVKELHEEHEAERRKMRDLLVRKLRRVRDIMSSSSDADAVISGDTVASAQAAELQWLGKRANAWNRTMLAKDAASAAMVAMFHTPTAKLNEKLSRAVTMYERESRGIADSISQLHGATQVAKEQLEDQRSHNERLVLRNASQAKAKEMLLAQLDELRKKHDALSATHETRETERRRALQETVQMQGDIISDLRGELKFHMEQYEEASKELRSLEREVRQRQTSAVQARKFFLRVAEEHSDFGNSSQPDTLNDMNAPPSGFLSAGGTSAELKIAAKSDADFPTTYTQMVNRNLQGIPVLGLMEPHDVGHFLALVASSDTLSRR